MRCLSSQILKTPLIAHLGAAMRGLSMCSLMLAVSHANAGIERDQAKRIHDRLAGVPPSEAVLDAMEADIIADVGGQGRIAAAYRAMENPAFYSATLKNLAAPWTNRDQDVFVPLNDYIATYIGLVRDEQDFREILFGDVLYVGTSGDSYSTLNNDNYEHIEENNLDMAATDASGNGVYLARQTQSAVNGLPSDATAGIITSRAAARAFFVDGTNRAMFRYTMLNHMCYDMEQVKDTQRPADRIRQDISRSPGGDSRLFINGCVGCHSGMDPMAQAFAYYQWQYTPNDSNPDAAKDAGQIAYTPGTVQPKYFINATTFPFGYVTPDDRWDNFWREGVNKKLLGWDTNGLGVGVLPGGGSGAKSLGEELANSEAFARCHVSHAFRTTCLREPADAADLAAIDTTVNSFKSGSYNLKQVFAETASYCAVN